jgi:putative flavoprotein involved in K+ transport
MTESVDVAVVGGGQAGLATSWHLTQAGVGHVVLEAGRIADTWRNRRWDSFCLVTPNWAVKLPGAVYAGDEPDGFMTLAELIDFFEAWAASSSHLLGRAVTCPRWTQTRTAGSS